MSEPSDKPPEKIGQNVTENTPKTLPKPSPESCGANPKPYKPRSQRVSRYQRIQERRYAQKAADNRYYTALFGLIGILSLLAILMGAIMINGVPQGVEGMRGWTTEWIFGFSKLEVAGFAFVGAIALSAWLRMRKKS